MRGRTERRCSLAYGGRGRLQAAHRPKGRHLPEQVKAKNPRGFGRQSHPIPSMTQ